MCNHAAITNRDGPGGKPYKGQPPWEAFSNRRRRCTSVRPHVRLIPHQRFHQKRRRSRDIRTAGRPFNNRSKATSALFILGKRKTPGPRCAAPLFLASEKSRPQGAGRLFPPEEERRGADTCGRPRRPLCFQVNPTSPMGGLLLFHTGLPLLVIAT